MIGVNGDKNGCRIWLLPLSGKGKLSFLLENLEENRIQLCCYIVLYIFNLLPVINWSETAGKPLIENWTGWRQGGKSSVAALLAPLEVLGWWTCNIQSIQKLDVNFFCCGLHHQCHPDHVYAHCLLTLNSWAEFSQVLAGAVYWIAGEASLLCAGFGSCWEKRANCLERGGRADDCCCCGVWREEEEKVGGSGRREGEFLKFGSSPPQL